MNAEAKQIDEATGMAIPDVDTRLCEKGDDPTSRLLSEAIQVESHERT